MSLCSNTLRAHLRSHRTPKTQTLLPFLYQTATIQQWHPQSRLPSRRYISYRTKVEDSIPFEDAEGNLPPRVEDVSTARKTTMTTTERAAFEKLYKTYNTQGEGRKNGNKGEHEELDQIADEYYEDDEDPSAKIVEKAFDTVLKGSPRTQKPQSDAVEPAANSNPVVPKIAVPETPRSKKLREARAARERMKKAELEERERVRFLLKNAHSDRDLWHVLDCEVFDPIRKLDLDGKNTLELSKSLKPARGKPRTEPNKKTTVDEKMLFANYSSHLLTALLTLRHQFSASQYPLRLMPTIKSLGRSSYALGATTVLYKHLLRTAWLQQSSYGLMDTLLTDMETNAIEFDAGILEVLDAIIKEHDMARTGKLGQNIKLVYGMEQWLEGIQKIKEWRKAIAMKLGIQDEAKRTMRRRPNLEMFDSPQALPMQTPPRAAEAAQDLQEEKTSLPEENKSGEDIPVAQDETLDILDDIMGKDDSTSPSSTDQIHEHEVENDEIEHKSRPAKVLM